MGNLYNVLVSNGVYVGLSLACLILSVICAVFVIIVVMIQPGNSSGIDALNGSSDTFYGKNKSKTIESKLRKLTAISVALLVVFMIAFFLIQEFLKVG